MQKRNSVERKTITSVEPCRHPAIFKSMCVSCGETLVTGPATTLSNDSDSRQDSSGSLSLPHNGSAANSSSLLFAGGQRLLLSKDEALRIQRSKSLGLQSARKLALVLDLDHTLVHATGAWSGYAAALGSLLGDGVNDIRRIFIEEAPGMPRKCYLVKLRPQLDLFLKTAHTICQMTIYTAGTRLYAEAVAKLIDPLGLYFAQRIVSRSDIPNDKSEGMEKSLQRIFLEDASMVVVMDDREDVWKGEQALQLLLVRPFHYFTGCEEVNNAAGSPMVTSGPMIKLSGDRPGSLVDINSVTRPASNGLSGVVSAHNDHDDQLSRCLTLLRKIHAKYFSVPAVNSVGAVGVNGSMESSSTLTVGTPKISLQQHLSVADIINSMKLSILAGCTIAFSGVIPVKTVVELHPCWQLAESMGARVRKEVTAETTHLITILMPPVPNSQGPPGLTSKAKECLGRGDVWVLHPDWLSYCRFSLAKAVESTFMLIAQAPNRPLPNPVLRPRKTPHTSSHRIAVRGESTQTETSRVRFQDDVVVDLIETEEPEPVLALGLGDLPYGGNKRKRLDRQECEEVIDEVDVDLNGDNDNGLFTAHTEEDDEDDGESESRSDDVASDKENDDDSDDGSMDNFEAAILLR